MSNKLAVIYGGPSPEHDISILTGLQAAKILSSKYQILNIYWSRGLGDVYKRQTIIPKI